MKIAILDTGCNPHEFFEDKNIYYCEDDNGHGTQLNGIVSSLAPFAEIYNFKVADKFGNSSEKYVIHALKKCIECNIDIILLAMGGTENNKELHQVIKECYKNKITIITSSGNSRKFEYYPANWKETISVGALLSDNKTIAPWSGKADIYTLGYNVATTSLNNSWFKATGTSFASAIITGYVAQLFYEKGKMTRNKTIKELLKREDVIDGYI